MTRQKLLLTWLLYGLITPFLLLCQAAGLGRLYVGRVHPFILPCIAALPAVYTSRRGGILFGFFFGFLCDMLFAGAVPCFYLLSFMLCGFSAGLLSRRVISPGLLCSLLVSSLSLFLTDLFQLFLLSFRGDAPLAAAAAIFAREFLITIPFVFLLHPLYSRIGRLLADI